MHQPPSRRRGSAFTLIELLVVIGIIVVLISILIPVVGRVRKAAQTAATKAFISNLSQAIDTYNAEQHAYPGPLSNSEISNDMATSGWNITTVGSPFSSFTVANNANTNGFDPNLNSNQITMAENLMLGLCGGLTVESPDPANPSVNAKLIYDPTLVGNGANSLNTVGPKKHNKAYVELKNVIWRDQAGKKSGQWIDDGGAAKDTIVPEFVDNYNDPMPILYLRARKGARATGVPLTQMNNTVITYTVSEPRFDDPKFRVGQFDLRQILGYTGSTIGSGRKLGGEPQGWGSGLIAHGLRTMDNTSINATMQSTPPTGLTYRFPYDPYPYFRNQSLSSPTESDTSAYTTAASSLPMRNDVPFGKDGYILISAGPDRVYGTSDDVTSFGQAGPQ